jgi:hypothetical protein
MGGPVCGNPVCFIRSIRIERVVEEMTELPELVDRKRAAEILSLSPRTLDRYVSQRLVPYVKYPGGAIRFKTSDLSKLIERRTVKANPFAA